KSRAPNLGQAMLRSDEKVRRQRHRLPGHHERVGIIGEQHRAHAREKQVVLQTQQTSGGAVTAAKISRGENRNARRRGPEQKEEQARECVTPQVYRQIREPDDKQSALGRCAEARQSDGPERHSAKRTERKKRAPDEKETRRAQQPGKPNEAPQGEERQTRIE